MHRLHIHWKAGLNWDLTDQSKKEEQPKPAHSPKTGWISEALIREAKQRPKYKGSPTGTRGQTEWSPVFKLSIERNGKGPSIIGQSNISQT